MTKVKFKIWDTTAKFVWYGNGRTAIQLISTESSSVIAVATVNIPDEPLAEDEVIVKNYAENEGMLEALTKAGIVTAPLRFVKTGCMTVPVCGLLIQGDGNVRH